MKTEKLITRAEYMADATNLHHVYFLQFANESTKRFILSSLKVDDIKKAIENGDINLNKIKIPYNNMSHGGDWWWDDAPINTHLLKDVGECNTKSTHTCVAKAMAKELIKI